MKIDPLLFKKAVIKPTTPEPAKPVQTPAVAAKPVVPTVAAKPNPIKITMFKPTVGRIAVAPKDPQQIEKPKSVSRVDMMVDITPPKVEAQAPLNFQERLNELDRLVNSQMGISLATIDTIRGHVMQIMIDLKQQPELDSCLIDRDVHNVLAYVRHTHVSARQELESSVKKKEVRAAKKGKGRFDVDLLDGPGSMFDSPNSLEELGDIET